MKQAARKTPQLSMVTSASTGEGRAPDSADSLEDYFSGWLDSVAPELSRERPPSKPALRFNDQSSPVTLTDMVRVNRATVRESTDHRHWPPEVVAQFLTADVIKRKNKRG
jgi:hypothetical protein